jgi:ectoine hydroxylase-related dioxygenase (phytanoyl-CoA dioxygenase family)
MASGTTRPATPSPNTDPKRFTEEGYVLAPGAFTPGEMEPYRHSLETLIERQIAAGKRPERLVEPHVTADDWRLWLDLCRSPRITSVAADALGTDELLLIMSHLIVKPPRDGMAVKWHQDNTYWKSVSGTDVLTVWLALDDVDEENGCMKVIPSSHAGYRELKQRATDGRDLLGVEVVVPPDMERSAVSCVLHAGEYSIHDSYVIHGSEPNTSDRRRAGYTMRIADARTVAVDLSAHRRPVYYICGDGKSLRPGYRDIAGEKPLPESPGEYVPSSAS